MSDTQYSEMTRARRLFYECLTQDEQITLALEFAAWVESTNDFNALAQHGFYTAIAKVMYAKGG